MRFQVARSGGPLGERHLSHPATQPSQRNFVPRVRARPSNLPRELSNCTLSRDKAAQIKDTALPLRWGTLFARGHLDQPYQRPAEAHGTFGISRPHSPWAAGEKQIRVAGQGSDAATRRKSATTVPTASTDMRRSPINCFVSCHLLAVHFSSSIIDNVVFTSAV